MTHPLETLIQAADGFVLIGESDNGRFPADSFNAYTRAGKRFYCLDLDGLTVSRGKSPGLPVYAHVEDLPDDHSDLAIVWVKPHTATRAVEVAHQARCTKVWFSFQTGHPEAVARAIALGMEVVEIGRCPVYYLDNVPNACKVHTALTRLSGTRSKPPQTDPHAKRRELW